MSYVRTIIVAIILIAITNAALVYYSNQVNLQIDNSLIKNQQKVISSISNTSTTNAVILHAIYHGDSKADLVLKKVETMFSFIQNESIHHSNQLSNLSHQSNTNRTTTTSSSSGFSSNSSTYRK